MFNKDVSHLLACSGLLLMILLAGCGSDNDPRPVDVHGTVTFNGQPVPHGVIYFDPDVAAGNDGVQGFAKIKDGAYDTRLTSKGIKGGAYKVRIRGGGGEPPQALFGEYCLSVDFPLETTARDFEIPASAAKATANKPAGTPTRIP